MSEILTIDLKELETKVENGKGFNHKEATVLLEFVRKIIGNGGTVPLQLMIPKSIADLLDKFIEIDFDDMGHEDWWIQENGLIEWFSKTPNCYIKDAYLAGKALGVDLVKVVEND